MLENAGKFRKMPINAIEISEMRIEAIERAIKWWQFKQMRWWQQVKSQHSQHWRGVRGDGALLARQLGNRLYGRLGRMTAVLAMIWPCQPLTSRCHWPSEPLRPYRPPLERDAPIAKKGATPAPSFPACRRWEHPSPSFHLAARLRPPPPPSCNDFRSTLFNRHH